MPTIEERYNSLQEAHARLKQDLLKKLADARNRNQWLKDELGEARAREEAKQRRINNLEAEVSRLKRQSNN